MTGNDGLRREQQRNISKHSDTSGYIRIHQDISANARQHSVTKCFTGNIEAKGVATMPPIKRTRQLPDAAGAAAHATAPDNDIAANVTPAISGLGAKRTRTLLQSGGVLRVLKAQEA
jgi:hypothetical protein